MDKIQKEQSFNKNEGKSPPSLTLSVLQMFAAKKKQHVVEEGVNPLAMLVAVDKEHAV